LIRLLVIEVITFLVLLSILGLYVFSRRVYPDRQDGLYDLFLATFGFGAGVWVASLVL